MKVLLCIPFGLFCEHGFVLLGWMNLEGQRTRMHTLNSEAQKTGHLS